MGGGGKRRLRHEDGCGRRHCRRLLLPLLLLLHVHLTFAASLSSCFLHSTSHGQQQQHKQQQEQQPKLHSSQFQQRWHGWVQLHHYLDVNTRQRGSRRQQQQQQKLLLYPQSNLHLHDHLPYKIPDCRLVLFASGDDNDDNSIQTDVSSTTTTTTTTTTSASDDNIGNTATTIPLSGGGGGGGERDAPTSPKKSLSFLPRRLLSSSLEGGKPIADTLVDAAGEVYGALLRRSRRLRLLRSRKSSSSHSNAVDTISSSSASSTSSASIIHAIETAEIALQEAEHRVLILRRELENAKKELHGIAGMTVDQELQHEQQQQQPLSIVALNEQKETMGMDTTTTEQKREKDEAVIIDSGNDGNEDTSHEVVFEHQQQEKEEEEEELSLSPVSTSDDNNTVFDLTTLSYDDVDYLALSMDMAPPFINEDECLVPGEPAVRVEKAPQNSRRIFAGIDIPVSVDEVWKLLTDYENLQRVVPNLVVNEVLELFPGKMDGDVIDIGGGSNWEEDVDESAAARCRAHALRMKGAVLRQVGGAKVAGINFSARTTLEVREWPEGMPDYYHHEDEVYLGKSRSDRAYEGSSRELERYVFPRPFALSSLPHKDISMQSVVNDDGEFRMYQGVWRMQPLPGCSPPGGNAMRLTYAVEISPRPYLPVGLVEGRIARDLCANLKAIRDVFN
jgi:hypothetical protein